MSFSIPRDWLRSTFDSLLADGFPPFANTYEAQDWTMSATEPTCTKCQVNHIPVRFSTSSPLEVYPIFASYLVLLVIIPVFFRFRSVAKPKTPFFMLVLCLGRLSVAGAYIYFRWALPSITRSDRRIRALDAWTELGEIWSVSLLLAIYHSLLRKASKSAPSSSQSWMLKLAQLSASLLNVLASVTALRWTLMGFQSQGVLNWSKEVRASACLHMCCLLCTAIVTTQIRSALLPKNKPFPHRSDPFLSKLLTVGKSGLLHLAYLVIFLLARAYSGLTNVSVLSVLQIQILARSVEFHLLSRWLQVFVFPRASEAEQLQREGGFTEEGKKVEKVLPEPEV